MLFHFYVNVVRRTVQLVYVMLEKQNNTSIIFMFASKSLLQFYHNFANIW